MEWHVMASMNSMAAWRMQWCSFPWSGYCWKLIARRLQPKDPRWVFKVVRLRLQISLKRRFCPLQMDGWKTSTCSFLLVKGYFQVLCHVSFREGNYLEFRWWNLLECVFSTVQAVTGSVIMFLGSSKTQLYPDMIIQSIHFVLIFQFEKTIWTFQPFVAKTRWQNPWAFQRQRHLFQKNLLHRPSWQGTQWAGLRAAGRGEDGGVKEGFLGWGAMKHQPVLWRMVMEGKKPPANHLDTNPFETW